MGCRDSGVDSDLAAAEPRGLDQGCGCGSVAPPVDTEDVRVYVHRLRKVLPWLPTLEMCEGQGVDEAGAYLDLSPEVVALVERRLAARRIRKLLPWLPVFDEAADSRESARSSADGAAPGSDAHIHVVGTGDLTPRNGLASGRPRVRSAQQSPTARASFYNGQGRLV